jgi:uncharacterized protein
MKKLFGIFVLSCFLLSPGLKGQVTLMSGLAKGSYNQIAKDIQQISGTEIQIIESEGSRDNFFAIQESKVDFAFLQYDVLFYQASLEDIISKKTEAIRIVLPLGFEEIHLITRKDKNINNLSDLHRKKAGIGSQFQGTIITVHYLRQLTGVKWKDVIISFEDAFDALKQDKIDAFFFVGSAPVARLNNISEDCRDLLKLVPIENESLKDYYTKSLIPAGTYTWAEEDVPTYAVRYALVNNILNESEEDRNTIRTLLTDIKNNMNTLLEEGHKVWRTVDFNIENIAWEVHEISKSMFRPQKIERNF